MAIKKKRQKRLEKGKIKIEILNMFFATNNKPLSSSEISKIIKQKFGLAEKRGINKHLEDLRNVELLTFDEKTQKYSLPQDYKENFWFSKTIYTYLIYNKNWERNISWLNFEKIPRNLKERIITELIHKPDFQDTLERLFKLLKNVKTNNMELTIPLFFEIQEPKIGSPGLGEEAKAFVKIVKTKRKPKIIVLEGLDEDMNQRKSGPGGI